MQEEFGLTGEHLSQNAVVGTIVPEPIVISTTWTQSGCKTNLAGNPPGNPPSNPSPDHKLLALDSSRTAPKHSTIAGFIMITDYLDGGKCAGIWGLPQNRRGAQLRRTGIWNEWKRLPRVCGGYHEPSTKKNVIIRSYSKLYLQRKDRNLQWVGSESNQ